MAANGDNGTRATGPRCVALVGPFQSGKTSLLEAILARTGVIARQGRRYVLLRGAGLDQAPQILPRLELEATPEPSGPSRGNERVGGRGSARTAA